MQHKLNSDDESTLMGLYEEHFGPIIAAQGQDEPIWTPGAVARAIPGISLKPGDLDSLDKVEFMMAVEEAFKVEIPDVVAESINTKGSLELYLGELLDSRRREPN